jgi:hypothetical protein
MPNTAVFNKQGSTDDIDFHFGVRSDRLNPTTDTQ